MDWQQIKTEYITTDTSYRKLAKKYGLNYSSICEKGKNEKWVDERDQFRVKTHSETIEAIGAQQVDRATRILTVADKLLNKIEEMVESVEPLDMSPKSIRALTAAVKDLREIQGIKSPLDEQEQEARIANLRKQAEEDDDDGEIQVIITGKAKEYAK